MEIFDKSNPRGAAFRDRVYFSLKRLEEIGLVKEVNKEVNVIDKNNNTRKIDISFIMCELMGNYLISVECKSRGKNLSLDDINQIKVYKSELPKRSIFWIISDAKASENVIKSLDNDSIIYYKIEDFEFRVSSLYNKYKKSNFKRLGGDDIKFSTMNVIQTTNLRLDSQKSSNMMVKNPDNSIFYINHNKNNPFGFDREQFKKAS